MKKISIPVLTIAWIVGLAAIGALIAAAIIIDPASIQRAADRPTRYGEHAFLSPYIAGFFILVVLVGLIYTVLLYRGKGNIESYKRLTVWIIGFALLALVIALSVAVDPRRIDRDRPYIHSPHLFALAIMVAVLLLVYNGVMAAVRRQANVIKSIDYEVCKARLMQSHEKQTKAIQGVFAGVLGATILGLLLTIAITAEEAPLYMIIGIVALPVIAVLYQGLSSVAKSNLKALQGVIFILVIIALVLVVSLYDFITFDINGNVVNLTPAEIVGLVASVFGSIAFMVLLALALGRKTEHSKSNQALVYGAVCIALAFVLNLLRVMQMPYGGSITLGATLPIMFYSHKFGIRKGVVVGFLFGFLQFLGSGGWFINPAQFLLDYPIPFAFIGLAGIFNEISLRVKAAKANVVGDVNDVVVGGDVALTQAKSSILHNRLFQFLMGGVVVSLLRFFSHFMSGGIVFAIAAAPVVHDGMNIWLYSLVYNVTYIFPDIAIALVLGAYIFASKNTSRVLLDS